MKERTTGDGFMETIVGQQPNNGSGVVIVPASPRRPSVSERIIRAIGSLRRRRHFLPEIDMDQVERMTGVGTAAEAVRGIVETAAELGAESVSGSAKAGDLRVIQRDCGGGRSTSGLEVIGGSVDVNVGFGNRNQ